MVRSQARLTLGALVTLLSFAPAVSPAQAHADASEVVLYSGRSKALVQPLIDQFTKETGIAVKVNYAGTTELALQVVTEGAQSPCDVFWAQDAGALGMLSSHGMLTTLPEATLNRVPEAYRSAKGEWVATSGRARVVAYSPERVKLEDLPPSVFDLVKPEYSGKVGWAPSNGSFQVFLTAMRVEYGDARSLAWLEGMKANGAKAYGNNAAIVEAIAAGEIDLGLPNHYYLLRYKKANANYPVENGRFSPEDIGNLLNVAGAAILNTAPHAEAAQQLVDFLLSPKAQQYFASDVLEYPVTEDVIPNAALWPTNDLLASTPHVDLDALADVEGTLALLQEAGLL